MGSIQDIATVKYVPILQQDMSWVIYDGPRHGSSLDCLLHLKPPDQPGCGAKSRGQLGERHAASRRAVSIRLQGGAKNSHSRFALLVERNGSC
jgi:hypothetical protein